MEYTLTEIFLNSVQHNEGLTTLNCGCFENTKGHLPKPARSFAFSKERAEYRCPEFVLIFSLYCLKQDDF